MKIQSVSVMPTCQISGKKGNHGTVNNRFDITSTVTLPNHIDSKRFVNINFRGEKELYKAVRGMRADYKAVKREIDKGTDVNCTYNGGYTPLIEVLQQEDGE